MAPGSWPRGEGTGPAGQCTWGSSPGSGSPARFPSPLAFPTTVEDRAIKAKPPGQGPSFPRRPPPFTPGLV